MRDGDLVCQPPSNRIGSEQLYSVGIRFWSGVGNGVMAVGGSLVMLIQGDWRWAVGLTHIRR